MNLFVELLDKYHIECNMKLKRLTIYKTIPVKTFSLLKILAKDRGIKEIIVDSK